MRKDLTQDKVWEWIQLENDDFSIEQFRNKHGIEADSSTFSVAIHRLTEQRKIKRVARGYYRKVKQIEPVQWWNGEDKDPLNFHWPVSYIDGGSGFDFEDCIEVFGGDLILISGVSNYGKTSLCLNLLAENLSLFGKLPRLMGSEYTAADGKITPKFKRRLGKMDWVDWVDEGSPKFELIPVGSDYEDYIESGSLNLIDWISLPGEYYMIDTVLKAIKDRVGDGLCIAVLQKNKSAEHGEGGERTQRYADVELKIDPFGEESLLTIGKVKASKKRASGRAWAFGITDYGAKLIHIREVVRCPKCWGKGYVREGQNNKRCPVCEGMKFIDK